MSHDIYKDMRISHDECYTTLNEARKLVKYIEDNNLISKNEIIWLPFDNDFSNIYKALNEKHFTTTISNLENGQDFYLYQPKEWDVIVTNPPFSGRTKLMKRLTFLNKPFIILQATQMFNNQFTVNYLCQFSEDYKFILPRSRMSFLTFKKDENIIRSDRNGASFYSFWLCYKTKLTRTFNQLLDSGKERKIESYDTFGNIIKDNHRTIFNITNDYTDDIAENEKREKR